MCGIAGLCSLSDFSPIEQDALENMLAVVHHRGPDEYGVYIDNTAALIHARLSIIDLSTGAQPIHNEEKNLWIIYNGEVFNYPELTESLKKRGHRFYTTSDTEVILHMYEELGPECLHKLNGQWGLAIWDSVKKELFVARDRIGIRPVHYTLCNGKFFFASEIKSLLAVPGIRSELDPVSLDQIFTYWTTLPGRTIFKDIHELPAGHYMTIRNGKVDVRNYWKLTYPHAGEHFTDSFESLREQADEILTDAIRIRLRADVPVGSYLSGGLDSSGITAKISRNFNNNLETYGIRFEEKAFDEGTHQQEMVRHLGVNHTELRATNEMIANAFPDVVYYAEKPILRTAPAPLFLLSGRVHENGLKVVLTGEGADEMFGGYNIFREAKVRNFWARQPESKTRAGLLKELYPYVFENPRLASTLQNFFAQGLQDTNDPLYSHKIRWMNTSKSKIFYSQALLDQTNTCDPYKDLMDMLPEGFDGWHYFSKAQYLEATIFLSNYLLSSQGDRMAMAHSLEIRLPYLDYRLMEFMSKVPPRWKVLGLDEKHLLKSIFKGTLPESITKRAKHPYRAPIAQTLAAKSNAYIREMLSERMLTEAGMFDPVKTAGLVKKMNTAAAASEVNGMAFTGILSAQIIYDKFVRNPLPASPLDKSKINVFIDKRS